MKKCSCQDCCNFSEDKKNGCIEFADIKKCNWYNGIGRIISFFRKFSEKWQR